MSRQWRWNWRDARVRHTLFTTAPCCFTMCVHCPKTADRSPQLRWSTLGTRLLHTQRTVIAWHLAVGTASFKCVLADPADIVLLVLVHLLLAVLRVGLDIPLPGRDRVERLDFDLHRFNATCVSFARLRRPEVVGSQKQEPKDRFLRTIYPDNNSIMDSIMPSTQLALDLPSCRAGKLLCGCAAGTPRRSSAKSTSSLSARRYCKMGRVWQGRLDA